MVTNIMGHHLHYLWFFLIILKLLCIPGTALEYISSTKPLLNNQTLVSATKLFEFGFFNPGNSDRWYIGIWYKDLPEKTIVWVANRDNPIRNASGILRINVDGNLVLEDEAACVVWTTNISSNAENRVVAKLLDTGNLLVYQENVDNSSPGKLLWQSFDYPTDTMLPGMKLGWDKKSWRNRYLTSWKKPDDPSSGDYTFMLNINGYPGAYLKKNREIIYRSGPWNGIGFSGIPEMMNTKSSIDFSFKMNVDEVSYMYELHNKSLYSRLLANSSGVLERYMWIPKTSRNWKLFWYATKDQCDNYQECGPYGICDTDNSPICKCMKGFRPKNPQAWFLRDGSDGCVRENIFDCKTDGFLKLSNMKLPESSNAFVDPRMSMDQCRETCQRNCSCMGYTNSNISHGGSGCVIWSSNLMDMRQFAPSEGGQDLYVRATASDIEQVKQLQLYNDHPRRSKQHIIVAGTVIAFLVIALGVSVTACILWRRKMRRVSEANPLSQGPQEKGRKSSSIEVHQTKSDNSTDNTSGEFELPLFDFKTIAVATNYFSVANRLGQGGFGVVYKGILAEGERIAVKRLSENSRQGVEEFRNELKLIAKLQHRNLVRLKGCCVDMEEKMLIYEYMENRSLDSIIFSKDKGSLLGWKTRFNIILGIAKGLVYLHQDSRFRVIHRDLKAANILLDKDMVPKISDFGMARIFGRDQTEANTKRIVGTYGYMSPEYAMDGVFSVKSDVFSFGVLLLEIISGKRNNRGFCRTNGKINLLAHAWKLLSEGRGLEFFDPKAGDSYSSLQVLRCIQVGLLCIQEQAEDRPTMGNVALMLSSESISLPQPKYPGFCMGRSYMKASLSSSSMLNNESCTINHVTITELEGR